MSDARIEVDIAGQHLVLHDSVGVVFRAPVSTAANGPGEQFGSECTPRGRHYIRARIGAGCAVNTVFVGRRPTGEIYSPQMRAQHPERDWILTRILWLCGLELGINRLGRVDTMRRYIYIHGCPDDDPVGVPGSHGCVKMRNTDIVRLFDKVRVGTRVDIRV
ncbi:MAG: L,D-transpeptidase [Pseudomonadota bacterium]|nr:MAG: L,D-transpeptidase [Pseudomonadota bacterium]